ncbi:glucose-1-phosphate cytidylyltransferase, partial [bacterium]
MQVVILCGGRGTRMGSDEMPKPMFPVGDKPILWHIMKIYSHYGFKDFVLCLGYKKEKIREYFQEAHDWNISFVDTGLDTNTAGRIYKAKNHIKDDVFFATYGDGLADINIKSLLGFHHTHKKIATL